MILFDTNIVSYMLKNDTRIHYYLTEISHPAKAISYITVAELFQWSQKLQWGSKRTTQMEAWLKQTFQILPLDYAMCSLWAKLTTDCRRQGFTLHDNDAWIAATAMHHAIPLVTHDADFLCLKQHITLILHTD